MVKTLMKRVIQSDIVMIEIDAMILDVQEILKTLLLKTWTQSQDVQEINIIIQCDIVMIEVDAMILDVQEILHFFIMQLVSFIIIRTRYYLQRHCLIGWFRKIEIEHFDHDSSKGLANRQARHFDKIFFFRFLLTKSIRPLWRKFVKKIGWKCNKPPSLAINWTATSFIQAGWNPDF